jgi:hypothetical protein
LGYDHQSKWLASLHGGDPNVSNVIGIVVVQWDESSGLMTILQYIGGGFITCMGKPFASVK